MPQQRKRKYGGAARYKNYRRGGKQLYKDVMYLKSLVNSELHYDYASYTTQNISSSGSIYHLSEVSQGDGVTHRSGNSIMPRYLNVQVRLQNSSTTLDTVRLLIFRWKDNSTPTIAELFENTSMPVYSPLNDNITGNSKDRQIDIIKSKIFMVGSAQANPALFYKKVFDLNPPGKPIKDHVKFDGTTATAPSGGIYMVLIGRQSTQYTVFEGMHKLSFHDN